MASKEPKVIGRRKGLHKGIVNARKIIRTQDSLETEISKDVMEAYSTIRATMYDKGAPAATRRSAANDIITMFDKLRDKSEVVLEEFEEEGDTNGKKEKSSNNVQPLFKYADD